MNKISRMTPRSKIKNMLRFIKRLEHKEVNEDSEVDDADASR